MKRHADAAARLLQSGGVQLIPHQNKVGVMRVWRGSAAETWELLKQEDEAYREAYRKKGRRN
jgi:hypothetical protein